MKRAVISDIHGNLEALQAVLRDIDRQRVDEVFCLGDIVGYGPNPCECVKLVREHCRVALLGNHDQAALIDPDGFNVGAERAIFWTRRQIDHHDSLPRNRADRLHDWLGELRRSHADEGLLYVHGSARRPIDEYVFPEDIYNPLKMEHIFELVPRYCFQGHTHIGGVFTPDPDFRYVKDNLPGGQEEWSVDLPEGKAMVNVGSVGQPRDHDPRACYVIHEDDARLRFRRIAYPADQTSRKIHAIADLDNYLGDRLLLGK